MFLGLQPMSPNRPQIEAEVAFYFTLSVSNEVLLLFFIIFIDGLECIVLIE